MLAIGNILNSPPWSEICSYWVKLKIQKNPNAVVKLYSSNGDFLVGNGLYQIQCRIAAWQVAG
jgi:hypothetical protein